MIRKTRRSLCRPSLITVEGFGYRYLIMEAVSVRRLRDKIFVPFFTTREKGSGIGLSLSRQIMRMHKGMISYKSVPGKETVFSLVF